MSIVKENKDKVSVHFDGVTDLLEFEPPKQHKEDFFDAIRDRENSPKWYGRGNYKASEVINKALLGDSDLNKYLDKMIATLDRLTGYHTKSYTQTITAVKRRRFMSDSGDELDIHKVYQGQLDTCWKKTERVEVDGKHHLVTLLIDLGGHSGQDATDSIWRSAIVAKLVRELEQGGKAVKIIAGISAKNAIVGSRKIITSTITIKDYNQSLSHERLAAMSHMGFMRTFCFGGFYSQEHDLHGGLGRPIDMVEKNMPIQLQEEIDSGHTKFVYIGRAMDERSALVHLENAFKQMSEFSSHG